MNFSASFKDAPLGRFSFAKLLPWTFASLFLGGWLTTSHFTPWVSWHAEAPFFAVVFVGAWVAVYRAIQKGKAHTVPFPKAAWPLVLLALVTLAQAASGQIEFLGSAFAVMLYLCLAVICIALGSSLAKQDQGFSPEQTFSGFGEWLAWLLLIGALISIAIALAQVLQVWESSPWVLRMPYLRRPGGNLGQPNHLATLVVMAIASVVYLRSLQRFGALACATTLLLLCMGIVITESRTGVLSLFVLGGWWFWKLPVISRGTSRWWLLPSAAVFLLAYASWPLFFSALNGGVQVPGPLRVEANVGDARFALWPQLMEAAWEKPWLGWGMRETAKAHAAVAHAYDYSLPMTYSHNLIIDMVLWTGLPIAGIILFTFLVWLWHRSRAIQTPLPWFGLAVALPLGIHSMLEFPFAYAYLLVPAMLGVGIVEGAQRSLAIVVVGARSTFALLLIISGMSVWSVVDFIRVEEDFRVARFEMLRIGSKGLDEDHPRILLLTQLGALVQAARVELKPRVAADEVELLRRVAGHYPWSGTQYRYAMALALNGQATESVRQLQLIRAQHGEKTYRQLSIQIENRLNELRGSDIQTSFQ